MYLTFWEKREVVIKTFRLKICPCLLLQAILYFPSGSLPHLGNVFQFLKQDSLSSVFTYVISFALSLWSTPILPSLFSQNKHPSLDEEMPTNAAHVMPSCGC